MQLAGNPLPAPAPGLIFTKITLDIGDISAGTLTLTHSGNRRTFYDAEGIEWYNSSNVKVAEIDMTSDNDAGFFKFNVSNSEASRGGIKFGTKSEVTQDVDEGFRLIPQTNLGSSIRIGQDPALGPELRWNSAQLHAENITIVAGVGRLSLANDVELRSFGDEIQIVGGPVVMPSLPTSDPANAGELWNDSGTVKVSSG